MSIGNKIWLSIEEVLRLRSEVSLRKEGFVVESISLNALKWKPSRKLRSEVLTKTTKRLGSLRDKTQGFHEMKKSSGKPWSLSSR